MAAPTRRITISDFKPGIFSEEVFRAQLQGAADQSLGDTLQPGAATVDGTYGCVADATGALTPLPVRVVEDSSTGVAPGGATFLSDGLAANYLLGVEFSGPLGDFWAGAEYFGSGGAQADILTTDRNPYQSLYTLWSVTVDVDGDKCATHGFYKVRQPRIAAQIGEYHTFYFFIEDMWGIDSGEVGRQFPFGSFVRMRTNVWGKPDYGTRWPVFNAGTFEQTMIALVEGVRVWDNDYIEERWDASVADHYFYLGDVGNGWFHPAGSFPPCTKNDPAFGWTTDSHMAIIGHYGVRFDETLTAGAQLYDSVAVEAGVVPGGWSAHFRDQSIVSFFKAMPFRVRHATSHQGRLVMISRRETETSDEILLYSDWLAPLQYTDDLSARPDEEEFGWDNKFFPPAIDNFVDVDVEWNMGSYDGATITAALYKPYVASRPYNLLLPGDDALGRTCSMGVAANGQLFLIKDQGGAVLVDGDLDNPTVRVAPNVEPTYGVESTGVHTPAGYVYGSASGVYAWDGGDASQHLSPQMQGFFWEHATEEETGRYLGARGSFQYWDKRIFTPNDYLFDTTTNSWWRLEPNGADVDEATPRHPYNRYLIDMEGDLWAFAYKVTADCTDYAFRYSTDRLRSSYSWHSQPLVIAAEHLVSVQDVEVVVTPVAGMNLSIDLIGYTYDATNGNPLDRSLGVSKVSNTITFPPPSGNEYDVAIDDAQTIRLRADVTPNFHAAEVSFVIKASSSAPDTPAPTIHQVSFGVGDRQRVPRLGSRNY